jgi:hypothetical protein
VHNIALANSGATQEQSTTYRYSASVSADFYGLKKYSLIKFSAGNAHVFHERLVIPYHSKGT